MLVERRGVRFDLLRGPSVAFCLVRLSEDDHLWTMTIHHILADGASMPIIDRDLATYYRLESAAGTAHRLAATTPYPASDRHGRGALGRGVRQIAAVCRYMVLLTAFQVVLFQQSEQRDFCVGLPVDGSLRSRTELSEVVGLFVTLVEFRCDLSGDPTFIELLVNTRDTLLDALDHQDLAYARVTTALDTTRSQPYVAA